jgi:hypothetical protein
MIFVGGFLAWFLSVCGYAVVDGGEKMSEDTMVIWPIRVVLSLRSVVYCVA